MTANRTEAAQVFDDPSYLEPRIRAACERLDRGWAAGLRESERTSALIQELRIRVPVREYVRRIEQI